jgi:hypothetical protein
MSDTDMWELWNQLYLQRKICQVHRQLNSLKVRIRLFEPTQREYLLELEK